MDLIVTLTCGSGAPNLAGLTLEDMVAAAHMSYWNALGNPAMSVPMGFTQDGLPLGLQIAGRRSTRPRYSPRETPTSNAPTGTCGCSR